MTACVYKITRTDGLEYVGITVNREYRFSAHRKSERFKQGIANIEILAECNEYEKAEELEELYITQYNTFGAGLNLTYDGKGKNIDTKFNTPGHNYSEASRKLMSTSAKKEVRTILDINTKKETKLNWSNKRKGKPAHNKKVSDIEIEQMIESYNNDSLKLSRNYDFIRTLVKVSDMNIVSKAPIEQLKSPNGKPLSLATIYAKYFSKQYNYSASLIREYLIGDRHRCKEHSV